MIALEILTIGGEILGGRTADTNFFYLARSLRARGLDCGWHTVVGDDRETLSAALEAALSRAAIVVTTGGLGATPDDITRKVIAAVLKRQLVLREDLLDRLAERYASAGRTVPPDLQAQALVPFGAELIDNEAGTAPGLRFRTAEGGLLYALPGVPHEMERMAERFVLPEIASLLRGPLRRERTIRTVGIPEARLAELVGPIAPAGVEVAYLPRAGTVDLKFAAAGSTGEAERRLAAVVAAARERIGPAVYAEGETDLAEAVGAGLLGRGWTLAVAESLTGGALGARIVSVPGASRYLLGDIVAYADRAKTALLGVPEAWIREHGAVSAPVAEAMAHGARERLSADVGISTTGIAGPDGATESKPVGLVYLGLAWPGGRIAVARRWTGGRGNTIERTVNAALDLVRRAAAGLDPDPGGG